MARSVVLMCNLGRCCLCAHVCACAFSHCKIFRLSSPITNVRRVYILSNLSTLQCVSCRHFFNLELAARCRSPHPSRVRGSPHPFSKKGAGRAVFRKNQHCNGAGSDRAATVREAFPVSAIWRLEERVGTGAFEACLQGQHWGNGVLPVVALLVSKGVASRARLALRLLPLEPPSGAFWCSRCRLQDGRSGEA